MSDLNGTEIVQSRLEIAPEGEQVRTAGAILFVASEPVPLMALARHLGCAVPDVRQVLETVSSTMQALGLTLQWADNDHVQIGTAPDLATAVRQFLGQERTLRLSQAALETVALIAYRQPITRSEIETVRGVDSSGVLQTLLARGIVEPVGRLQTVGTPLLYSTTPEFLRLFGLTSLAELPRLPDDLITSIDERATAEESESTNPS